MPKRLMLLIVLLSMPTLLFGQLKSQSEPPSVVQVLRMPVRTMQGLGSIIGFDPSKLHISQSYSLSYFALGGQNFAQGLYLNTMEYEFSSPLTMRLQWGFAHSPLSNQGVYGVMGSGPFISAAQLHYQPSKKLSIGIEYNALPYYYGRNSMLRRDSMWRTVSLRGM